MARATTLCSRRPTMQVQASLRLQRNQDISCGDHAVGVAGKGTAHSQRGVRLSNFRSPRQPVHVSASMVWCRSELLEAATAYGGKTKSKTSRGHPPSSLVKLLFFDSLLAAFSHCLSTRFFLPSALPIRCLPSSFSSSSPLLEPRLALQKRPQRRALRRHHVAVMPLF